MEALMQLQIITPDHLMCDESVKMVEMRTAEGRDWRPSGTYSGDCHDGAGSYSYHKG